MTYNLKRKWKVENSNTCLMENIYQQFKRTAAGILPIVLLSSAMIVATVSISSAAEIAHISAKELKGKCARSKGKFTPSRNGGVYSCEVAYPDGSIIDVACTPGTEGACSWNKFKRVDPKEVDLCARTTLGKPDPVISMLCKSKRKSGSLLQK